VSEARLLGEGVGVYFFTLSLLFVAGLEHIAAALSKFCPRLKGINVIAVFIEFNLQ
jgi:hypothetical protein